MKVGKEENYLTVGGVVKQSHLIKHISVTIWIADNLSPHSMGNALGRKAKYCFVQRTKKFCKLLRTTIQICNVKMVEVWHIVKATENIFVIFLSQFAPALIKDALFFSLPFSHTCSHSSITHLLLIWMNISCCSWSACSRPRPLGPVWHQSIYIFHRVFGLDLKNYVWHVNIDNYKQLCIELPAGHWKSVC